MNPGASNFDPQFLVGNFPDIVCTFKLHYSVCKVVLMAQGREVEPTRGIQYSFLLLAKGEYTKNNIDPHTLFVPISFQGFGF